MYLIVVIVLFVKLFFTPVTLHNVQMSPSLKSSGKFDVKYNHRSNMTPARNLDFEFQLPEHTKYRTIKEVEENLNAFQKVKIIC